MNKVNTVEKTAGTAGLRNRSDIQKNAWLPLATAAISNKPVAEDRRKLVNNNPNRSTDTSGGMTVGGNERFVSEAPGCTRSLNATRRSEVRRTPVEIYTHPFGTNWLSWH